MHKAGSMAVAGEAGDTSTTPFSWNVPTLVTCMLGMEIQVITLKKKKV